MEDQIETKIDNIRITMAAIVPDQHAAQWKRMGETANNTNILFQRT